MSSIGGGSWPRRPRSTFVNDCCDRREEAARLRVVVGRDHVRRDHRVRLSQLLRRLEPLAVDLERRQQRVGREVRRERVRQAQRRRELCAVEARAEDPERARATPCRGSPAPPAPAAGRRAAPAARARPAGTCRSPGGRGAARAWSAGRCRARGRGRGRCVPGCSAASVPNCSAITSGAWFGSMIPPAPTRIVRVPAGDVRDHDGRRGARDAGRRCGAPRARSGCSPSARRAARGRASCAARPATVPPSTIGARSRIESGGTTPTIAA